MNGMVIIVGADDEEIGIGVIIGTGRFGKMREDIGGRDVRIIMLVVVEVGVVVGVIKF
jgi:hypothetical protein